MSFRHAHAFVVAVFLCAACGFATAQEAQHFVQSQATTGRPETTTFNFANIPVRSALLMIAEEGHFNLVLSDSVQGTVSLHLVNVTWEQALDTVLRLKGLRQSIDGNMRSLTTASESQRP